MDNWVIDKGKQIRYKYIIIRCFILILILFVRCNVYSPNKNKESCVLTTIIKKLFVYSFIDNFVILWPTIKIISSCLSLKEGSICLLYIFKLMAFEIF